MRARPALAGHSGSLRQEQAPTGRRRYVGPGDAPRQVPAALQDADGGRSALMRRLTQIDQQITEGREQFARQVDIVSDLERAQGDTASARATLQLLARVHVIRLDERERLRRLLEAALD